MHIHEKAWAVDSSTESKLPEKSGRSEKLNIFILWVSVDLVVEHFRLIYTTLTELATFTTDIIPTTATLLLLPGNSLFVHYFCPFEIISETYSRRSTRTGLDHKMAQAKNGFSYVKKAMLGSLSQELLTLSVYSLTFQRYTLRYFK